MKNEIKLIAVSVYACLVTFVVFKLLPSDSNVRAPYNRLQVEEVSKSEQHPKLKHESKKHRNAKTRVTNPSEPLEAHIKLGEVHYPLDNSKATEIPSTIPAALNSNTETQLEYGYPVQVAPKEAQ